MRGTSSDRIIAKKRHDQKSVSSLGEKTNDSGGSAPSGLFEKHLGKFYKLSKAEKAKRSSANALYDRSPTEAFYNKTGSARLSSQELFEKFCSEDFVSLYGHESDNGEYSMCCRRNEECYQYSKSLESSHLTVQVKCSTSDEQTNLDQPTYTTSTHKEISLSLGAIKKNGASKKLDSIHAGKKFDYSTDLSYKSPGSRFYVEKHHRTHFSFDVPFSLPPEITDIIDYEIDDSMESIHNIKDHSQSAPLLSPDKEGTQFTFDIPDISNIEDLSNQDDSPSDATETRNLTLYEEPRSDRTSLSDIYEPCFSSSGIRSKRSSIKRDLAYKSRAVFDLTNLDFRPIDDESPNTSKFVSVSSPDGTNPSNFDSKSYYSDSVFVSPEKISSKDDSSKCTETVKNKLSIHRDEPHFISEQSDSTTLEEEPISAMDKIPEIFIEKFDQFVYDPNAAESHFEYTERTLSPVIETKSDSINLSESSKNNSLIPEEIIICSRPSMHKLEPFYPRKLSTNSDASKPEADDSYLDSDKVSDHYDKVRDLPELSVRREKSMLFKIKKVRDSGSVAVHKRTRCFPL